MHFKSSAMKSFGILFLITCVLAILIPPNPHTLQILHISTVAYRLIILALLLPYGVIWFAAFYGYDQLAQYAHALKNTAEGHAFKKIADGLRVLAWGFILSTILNLLLSAITDIYAGFAPARAIIDNYALLVVALVALTLIGDGTYILLGFVKAARGKNNVRILIALACIVGVLFARAVVHNSNVNDNPYYLSIYPLLLTLVVPYIYAWVVGGLATMDLRLYSRHVKGILYKQALQRVAGGLNVVILVSIAIQFTMAAFTRNQSMSVGVVLLLDYVLLAGDAIGYILIAIGAKRLKMIEEV